MDLESIKRYTFELEEAFPRRISGVGDTNLRVASTFHNAFRQRSEETAVLPLPACFHCVLLTVSPAVLPFLQNFFTGMEGIMIIDSPVIFEALSTILEPKRYSALWLMQLQDS